MAQRRKARRRSKETWLVFENIMRHIPIKFPSSFFIRNLKLNKFPGKNFLRLPAGRL